MNKKETAIILKSYKEALEGKQLGFDKDDTIRTFKFMLDSLGLKKERYIVENEIIIYYSNIDSISIEMYSMIFENFMKYNKYVNYNINEIEMYFDDLQFVMTEEEVKCNKARINYIINNTKVA